jgi:hypothetical protein
LAIIFQSRGKIPRLFNFHHSDSAKRFLAIHPRILAFGGIPLTAFAAGRLIACAG